MRPMRERWGDYGLWVMDLWMYGRWEWVLCRQNHTRRYVCMYYTTKKVMGMPAGREREREVGGTYARPTHDHFFLFC